MGAGFVESSTVTAYPDPASKASTYRLNVFQRLMRAWREFGPYNAGQVMTVQAPLAIAQWEAAARRAIADLGIGVPRFTRDGVTYSAAAPAG